MDFLIDCFVVDLMYDDFILKIPNASDHPGVNIGDKVNLGWSVEDCRALD